MNIIFLGGEDVSARIDISKKLIELGNNVKIIGNLKEYIFNQNNIAYTSFNLNRELNVFDDIKSIISLRRVLVNIKDDYIVHAFDTKLTIFLPIASFGLDNIKVVRTINGMGRLFTKKSINNNFLVIIYKIIQKLIKGEDVNLFSKTLTTIIIL